MAEPLKAKQKLNKGRYTISKVIAAHDTDIIYNAKDKNNNNDPCAIYDIYDASKLSPAEKEKIEERFQNSLIILTSFEHPNLANIYDYFVEDDHYYVVLEYVDGVTLKTMLSMSVKPLPEKQVLDWAIQICKAMQYMHNRPKPFIFDALDAGNIMIDQDENIRLINFGLASLLNNENAVKFSSSPAMISEEIKLLAKTIVYLLTRKEVDAFGSFDTESVEISEPMIKLLNRLLADGNGGVSDFDRLMTELDNIKNPPKKASKRSSKGRPEFNFINFTRLREELIEKFMKQPIWLIASEAVAVLAVCLTFYMVTHPSVDERVQSAFYISCGNELHSYSASTQAPLGRIRVGYQINNLQPTRDGNRLYCSLQDSSHVAVVNAKSNRLIGTFQVGANPSLMVLDALEQWLYVLQGNDGLVTAVQINKEPLPDLPTQNAIKDSAVGMYSVGRDAHGLAIYKSPQKVTEGKGADAKEYSEVILCSSSAGNVLDSFVNPPMESIASQYCKSAGAIAVSKDGQTAVVAQSGTAQLEFFNTSNLKSIGLATQTGGSEVRQLIMSPSGQEVWCVNGSGSLGVVSMETRKLVGQVKTAGKPVDGVWNLVGSKPELWVITTNPDQLLIVDPSTKTTAKSIDLGGTPSDICFVEAPAKPTK